MRQGARIARLESAQIRQAQGFELASRAISWQIGGASSGGRRLRPRLSLSEITWMSSATLAASPLARPAVGFAAGANVRNPVPCVLLGRTGSAEPQGTASGSALAQRVEGPAFARRWGTER
jgi:hypothetical protein